MMCFAAMVLSSPPLPVMAIFPCPCELCLAVDHRDLVLLHQVGDAARELGGDLPAPLDDAGEIEAEIVASQTELRRAAHLVIELGGAEQSLGGDAAPVEADAAEMLALDDRRLEPELRGADGRDIASRPRADHGKIEVRVSHHLAA